MVGSLGRINFSQIGFKPNLIVVRGDSQGGDAIQELIYGETSIGSSCSVSSELMWRLLSMTREVIVGAAAEQAVIRKPPSRRVWPIAKAPLTMAPSLKTGKGIPPDCDDTEELSMKAPMSVSKPADLG